MGCISKCTRTLVGYAPIRTFRFWPQTLCYNVRNSADLQLASAMGTGSASGCLRRPDIPGSRCGAPHVVVYSLRNNSSLVRVQPWPLSSSGMYSRSNSVMKAFNEPSGLVANAISRIETKISVPKPIGENWPYFRTGQWEGPRFEGL